jgi:hypothetical protein
MRKTMKLLAGTAVTAGLLAVTAPGAVAVAQPSPQNAQADCVKVVRWYSEKSSRKVEVKNSCARQACFTVTVEWKKDPKYAIAAHKQASFRYGGTLWSQGSGIKNVAC